MNLNFFQVLKSALFKNKKKIQKWGQATKQLHDIVRDKRKSLKKREEKKTKNENKSNKNNIFSLLLSDVVYVEKFKFDLENIFGQT